MTNLTEEFKKIIEAGLTVSYKNLVSLSKNRDKYLVEYESYFNPHANPKQLMDQKLFDSAEGAVNYFIERISSEYPELEY